MSTYQILLKASRLVLDNKNLSPATSLEGRPATLLGVNSLWSSGNQASLIRFLTEKWISLCLSSEMDRSELVFKIMAAIPMKNTKNFLCCYQEWATQACSAHSIQEGAEILWTIPFTSIEATVPIGSQHLRYNEWSSSSNSGWSKQQSDASFLVSASTRHLE